jgi:hypothetical protein
MILLNTTLKSLELVLEGAITTNALEWTLSAVDLDSAFKLSAVVSNDGVSNNTTHVTLLAAPASTHARQVKLLTVYNADTVDAVVLIKLNNNGTRRRMERVVLEPGESLVYVS